MVSFSALRSRRYFARIFSTACAVLSSRPTSSRSIRARQGGMGAASAGGLAAGGGGGAFLGVGAGAGARGGSARAGFAQASASEAVNRRAENRIISKAPFLRNWTGRTDRRRGRHRAGARRAPLRLPSSARGQGRAAKPRCARTPRSRLGGRPRSAEAPRDRVAGSALPLNAPASG